MRALPRPDRRPVLTTCTTANVFRRSDRGSLPGPRLDNAGRAAESDLPASFWDYRTDRALDFLPPIRTGGDGSPSGYRSTTSVVLITEHLAAIAVTEPRSPAGYTSDRAPTAAVDGQGSTRWPGSASIARHGHRPAGPTTSSTSSTGPSNPRPPNVVGRACPSPAPRGAFDTRRRSITDSASTIGIADRARCSAPTDQLESGRTAWQPRNRPGPVLATSA